MRNTLTQSLGNGELLAIAEQTAPATNHVGRAVVLGSAAVPNRLIAEQEQQNSLRQTIGKAGGIVALIALPLLAIPLLKRRRELSKLRAQLAATLHFESQLVSVTGVPTGPPAPFSQPPGEWSSMAYQTRRPPLRTNLLGGALALLLVGVGAYGLVINIQGTSPIKHFKIKSVAPTVPTVQVAVLNSTPTPGAAGRLAVQLRHQGIKIGNVTNLNEQRPPGLAILYEPGNRGQAELLKRVLAAQHPTIALIDPVAQAAVGSGAKLAVVIA